LIRAAVLKKAGDENKTSGIFGFTSDFSLLGTLKREGVAAENLQNRARAILNAINHADEGKFLNYPHEMLTKIVNKKNVNIKMMHWFHGPQTANPNNTHMAYIIWDI